MSKKRGQREAQWRNNRTYLMYYNRLRDIVLSLFKWEGLPDSVNQRFLEIKLFELGSLVFFEDEDLGYLTLPVTYTGLNVYEEPTKYRAYSINYHKELDPENAVIIWNNFSRNPIKPILEDYAYRLYEVTRTQDVNVKAQKTPVLIRANESQRLTMENMYRQYEGNEPFIFGTKDLDPNSIEVLKTDAPYVSDKLQVLKNDIWNEAMTFLGVGNAKQDKKERLVADEVSANDEQIESMRYVMLDARQKAVKEINQMFGLNISVDFKLNEMKELENDIIEPNEEKEE